MIYKCTKCKKEWSGKWVCCPYCGSKHTELKKVKKINSKEYEEDLKKDVW